MIVPSEIEIVQPEIARNNFLDTLDTIFEAGGDIIAVKGSSGYGKTTLLRQFARRHAHTTVTTFIRPLSPLACDPEILLSDLCEQAASLAGRQLDTTKAPIDRATFRDIVTVLQGQARRRRTAFYFLIDGLDDIPEDEADLRKSILDLFPWGLPNFRFLVSGEHEYRFGKNVIREFFLPAFTPGETAQFLASCSLSVSQLEEFHRHCRGIPGHLASVRRLLRSGTPAVELMEHLPQKAPDLFEYEWRAVDMRDDVLIDMLAILAFGRKRYTTEELARITATNRDGVVARLSALDFVTIQENEPIFTSEAFRKFIALRLQQRRRVIHDRLIDDLLRAPASDDAITHVPGYMQEAGRLDELLAYLSPQHFATLLERSQSLAPIQKKAELGMTTAGRLRRDGDFVRFGMQQAATAQLSETGISRSEVEARMALGDHASARRLAQSAVLKEDQLHLLAVVARVQRSAGGLIDQDITAQIERLACDIDADTLGARAIAIAAELIPISPTTAMSLIERATSAQKERTETLDWAIAHAAVAAASDGRNSRDAAQVLQARIADPTVRQYSRRAALMVGSYSASEAIAEVSKLDTTSDKMGLLRRWAIENNERHDAGDVVAYAIKLAIGSPEYSPTARTLKDLAAPLPHLPQQARQQLLAMFEAQRPAAERVGPTDDYVDFWLLTIRAAAEDSLSDAYDKVAEVFVFVTQISDLATKASCLARILSALHELSRIAVVQDNERMCQDVERELGSSLTTLIDGSADQLHGVRPVLHALVRVRHDMALQLALRLNTVVRRDEALMEIIDATPPRTLTAEIVFELVDVARHIVATDLRDFAFASLFELAFGGDAKWAPTDAVLSTMLGLIDEIGLVGLRCRAASLLYVYLRSIDPTRPVSTATDSLYARVQASWRLLEPGPTRVIAGFDVARTLANSAHEQALWFLKAADDHRQEIGIGTIKTTEGYVSALRLAIRGFGGLLRKRLDNNVDIDRLAVLIELVPSLGGRASLWADIAFRFYASRRSEDAATIVKIRIRPLLDQLWADEPAYASKIIVDCAHALYLAHKTLAVEQLEKLTAFDRDEACRIVANALLSRKDPFDSRDNDHSVSASPEISYEEIVEIIEVLKNVSSDEILYGIFVALAEALTSKRAKDRVTQQQRADIARRLGELATKKLPNPAYIKHNGYLILCQACVERIRPTGKQEWDRLVDGARTIPNVADKVFVLSSLSAAISEKASYSARSILQEAFALVPSLPLAFDHLERYQVIASDGASRDSGLSKTCLKRAMDLAASCEGEEAHAARRSLVDLAYRLDPELANSIASAQDDDPARKSARDEMRRRIEILALKKSFAESANRPHDKNGSNWSRDIPKVAWSMLGSLNGGRIAPLDKDRCRELFRSAATRSLDESYPMFALAIESLVVKYGNTEEALGLLRPLFDGLVLAVEVAGRIALHVAGSRRYAGTAVAERQLPGSLLVRPGERDLALRFIEDWLRKATPDILKICDPYFGPDDVGVLRLVKSACPSCRVEILTSRKAQGGVQEPWEASYRQSWRRFADDEPPETEIVIVGSAGDGQLPIHDRWWLTSTDGLRLGTSYNSIGHRESEISVLSPTEVAGRAVDVDRYLRRLVKEHDGRRLICTLFTL